MAGTTEIGRRQDLNSDNEGGLKAGCQSNRVWEVRKSIIMAGTTESAGDKGSEGLED